MDTTAQVRVAGANVLVVQNGDSSRAIADAQGTFRIDLNTGAFRVIVSAAGYALAESAVLQIARDQNLSLVVYLSGHPFEMAPVVVVGHGRRPRTNYELFQQRMRRGAKTGFGFFFDEAMISARTAITVSDILARVPGARVGRDYVSLRPRCADAMYLIDGVPVRARGTPDTAPGSARPTETATLFINSMLSVTDIAGIEVYKSSAELPAQLIGGAMSMSGHDSCGVVAIWTKR